jgi:hypothetical protein
MTGNAARRDRRVGPLREKRFQGKRERTRVRGVLDTMTGRTVIAACFTLAAVSGAARALERPMDDPAGRFAACAGRYSAEMRHAWLAGDPGTLAAARRDRFDQLTDAAAQPGSAPGLLDRRIRAGKAQARLLGIGRFHTDRVIARRARAAARRQRALCDAILTG